MRQLEKILLVFSAFCICQSFSDYCSKHDCSPRTFIVKKSPKEYFPLIVEEEEATVNNQCWQYTWLGAVDESTNKTSSCSKSPEFEGIPCFEPIVWTNGTNKNNQPDLSDLEKKCEDGLSVQNTVCVPFCIKNEKMCVKMTYYNRDDARTIQKTVSFCGKGIETTEDNEVITSGCHTEYNNADGLDVEACFCNSPRCNKGTISRPSPLAWMMLSSAISLSFTNYR